MQVIFNIPDSEIQRIIAAFSDLYPIPADEENGEPLFTANNWPKERIRRFIVDTVYRSEQRSASDTASLAVTRDNNLTS